MAKSLDELVDFLLDEIALDGDRGASLQDIVHYTKHFYAQPYVASPPSLSTTPQCTTNRIDRKFVGQLWKWLAQHKDLSIGRRNEFKTSSLDEIEAAFPELLTGALNSPEPVGLLSGNPGLINNALLSRPAAAQKKDVGPRVIANQDRIYYAVCGHEPDPAKVSELEFSLLCTIGAARNDGILQGELGRVTKQDKRSVPKRTDTLRQRGYVVKQPAYHRGHKTSRIFLRRFAYDQTNSSTAESTVRLLDLARQILTACREYPFITQDDLAQLLSISSSSKRHIFDQVIRHLVRRECLKKVKTAFAPDSATNDLRLTLQFVRELEETDLEEKDGDLVDLNTHLDTVVDLSGEVEIDSGEDAVEAEKERAGLGDQSSPTCSRPSWNPDRSLPNAVHDLAVLSGDHGITNVSVRQKITGLIVKRPVESILVRLSRSALKNQPSSVRDLALVRTTEGGDGVHRFVHRSLEAFSNMVDRGELTWSSANGGNEFAKHIGSGLRSPTLDMQERDDFGFKNNTKLGRQMNDGRVTLEDIANVPGSGETVVVRSGEATVVTDSAGARVVSTKPEQVSNTSSRRSKTPKRLSYVVILKLKPKPKPIPPQPEPILQQPGSMLKQYQPILKQLTPKKKQNVIITKPLGRPRKFMHGTEEYWQALFWIKRHGSDSEPLKTTKETGLMNDPDCLKMFADRPRNFDQTLVEALHQELPVPRTPEGISDMWVNKTNEFLDRKGVGAFYVPPGTLDLRQSKWSCPVVIRSTRLGEVDVTDRRRPAFVLFLSSSAAHSFRHYRSLQWYLGVIEKDTRARSNSTADISKSATQVVKTTTTGKDDNLSQSEGGPGGMRAIDKPPKNDFVFVNRFAAPGPPPIPALTLNNISDPMPSSSRKSTGSYERVQRQRRPTQKALESAQSFVPSGSDIEFLDDGAAVSGNTNTKSKAIAVLPSPFLEEHFSSNDIAPANTTIRPAVDVVAASDNGTHTPRLCPPLTASDEPSSWGPSENDVPNASHPSFFEPIQKTPGRAEVRTEVPSSEVIPGPSTSVELPRADSRPATNFDEGSPEADIGPGNSNDFTSNVATELVSGLTQSSIPHASEAVDSAPLQLLVGRDAVPYYKKFLVELVCMCGGVVPHDPSLLKRAMGSKAVEAHVEPNMNIKLIKSCISQLTQNGKLKIMQFAFQRNGFNHTKAIIALPNMQPNDQLFLAMQTKISLLPANVDYVPPELEREASRRPQGVLRHADAPILGAKPKIKRVASARPKRQNNQSELRSRRSSSLLSRQLSLTPAPPDVSPNTGFLTLKVPGIARIQTDKAFTSNYFSLPAQPLIIDPYSHAAISQSSPLKPSSRQRNEVPSTHRSAINGATRTIQWRVPKYTPLPKSLRAILAYDRRVNEVDHNLSINPALETFDKDVDFVAAWEQKNFDDLQEPKPQEWNFINHLSFKKEFVNIRREGDLQFRQITYDSLHEEVETDLPEAESWEAFAEILAREATKLKKANENKKKRKRKTQEEFVDGRSNDEDEEGLSDFNLSGEEPTRKRQRGPVHKWYRKPRVAGTEKDRRRHKRNHANPRGIGLRDIPKALAHRITTAIVVVRVLAGGLDKYLDWKLVARLIPGEPESMLQSRWRTLSTRYNNDFDSMVQDLQTKYLDALADDKVPSVNYNDLQGTDWEGIFAWAVANINAESTGATVTEIPPNRDDFLELNMVEVGEPMSVRYLHNLSLQYTQATKEDFWCSVVFGTSANYLPIAAPKHIEARFPAEDDEANLVLARARSWVFAAVVTPHQSFDPHSAHEKLRRLAEDKRECEQLIESTLKKLQNDKMVVTKDSADAAVENDGSTLSGTYDWKLSTKFSDRFELNRYITSRMLKQAVRYKIEVLDPSFARGEPVVVPGNPLLEDGVMVAIFNLMNAGMLQLEPGADMPATRYGIDGESEGYQTRSMDKKNLFFSTILRSTSTYALGDLSISERKHVAIPRGDMDQEDGFGLIPLWFDINYDFRPDIWDMIVGGIIGMISCRPGLSTIELVRTFGYVLSQKDLGMITHYLFNRGMIEKTCTGWETTDTWWFAVGTGTESGIENGV